jgi:hypothetical protein
MFGRLPATDSARSDVDERPAVQIRKETNSDIRMFAPQFCLDNIRHVRRVIRTYADYYSKQRYPDEQFVLKLLLTRVGKRCFQKVKSGQANFLGGSLKFANMFVGTGDFKVRELNAFYGCILLHFDTCA